MRREAAGVSASTAMGSGMGEHRHGAERVHGDATSDSAAERSHAAE